MIWSRRDAQAAFEPTVLHYDHNVVPFKRDKAGASYAAQLLEENRVEFEVSPDRREERRLFNAYMAAIREQVAATERVNETHNAWMKAAEAVKV